MLGDDVPADAVVDAVLQQHGPVDRVGLIQGDVTAVRLRHAADLQHKHDLAARGKKRRRGTVRGGEAYLDIFNEYMCCTTGRKMVVDGFKEWEFISYTSHSFWNMYSMSCV